MKDKQAVEFKSKLKEHKLLEEDRLVSFLAEKYKLPVIKAGGAKVDPDAIQMVKEVDSREAKVAVFEKSRGNVKIAVNEPKNENLPKILRDLEGRGYSHELYLASNGTLEKMWSLYKDIVATSATVPGAIYITNEELERDLENTKSLEDVKKLLDGDVQKEGARKISKNIERFMAAAIAIGTSDVHIEPKDGGGVIRYRVDGVLKDVYDLDKKDLGQLLTRMKLVSSMKITKNIAQDGGFVIHLSDRVVSVRTSVIPEEEGGSFVIRILDPKNVVHSIERLGLHPIILEVFQKQIQKPNGMILTTGPTGSGKTTTLYSFLTAVKGEDVKTITLEDPIEYRLEGIVQTQIGKNYSFASGLRAIVRQDPDIILVGEIRDTEVAEISIQASLTGHLVFSTLHTNDALGTLPRLEQLGVNPQTFSRAINAIIAQRLARILCKHCSEKHPLTEEQKKIIKEKIEAMPSGYRNDDLDVENIRRPSEASKTCQKCAGGYKGRIGVFEVFEVTDEVVSAYKSSGGVLALRDAVKAQDLPFMEDDGLWKVLKGETSLEELRRVLGLII